MVYYGLDNSSGFKAKKGLHDDHWIGTQRKKGFLVTKFREFCNRTDLHGYKYIVMEDINLTERSCWALAVVVSIGFAAYFVVTAYRWYARNPIVTVIESTHGVIWDIPFPAVTICDLNVISRKAAQEFANNVTLPPNITADKVFEVLRWAPLLHSTFKANETQKEMLGLLQTVLDLNHISMEAFFVKMSPVSSCSQLVQRCMWKNTVYRCDLLFQQVFTQLNLCCVFNYYAVDVPIYNDKAANELFRLKAPRRVASCGYQTALTVLINTDPADYYSSSVASQGALVFIDNSYNVPDLDSPVRMVNPSTEVLIALSPERTYATPGIKSFRPDQRQCYYNDEITIGQFRQYSYHNCLAFRKVEILKKACDCIPFYFPVKEYYRPCNFKDMNCLENFLSAMEMNEKPDKEKDLLLECLPECEHYDYPLEVALGMLGKHAKLNGLAFFNDVNLEGRSLLNVFFNDLVSTRYRRDVYLNWQNILDVLYGVIDNTNSAVSEYKSQLPLIYCPKDVLYGVIDNTNSAVSEYKSQLPLIYCPKASFGGLLSLMLGFTLISGFDLLIFFTFKIAYDALKSILLPQDLHRKPIKDRKGNKVHIQDHASTTTKRDTFSSKHDKWETNMRDGNVRF